MRNTFINTLVELAERDPRIVLLTGDLGFTVVEPFVEAFPARFYNVGVAEQNMAGLATGLADGGYIPFMYSIATFASMRAYEFIRNGPVLHGLPVRIVGVGGGFEYGPAGATHFALEDVGLMRLQPGMTVIAPADYRQARQALLASWDLPGPVYYRLGKNERDVVPGLDGAFELGRLDVVRDGRDLAFVAMGSLAPEVLRAAETLAQDGIEATVAIAASLSPPPEQDLLNLLRLFDTVVTAEAHYPNGGVGSLVAEVMAEHGLACRLLRCAVNRQPDGVTGSEAYMHAANGLDCQALAAAARRAIDRVTL